jgi:hypothetical protein
MIAFPAKSSLDPFEIESEQTITAALTSDFTF